MKKARLLIVLTLIFVMVTSLTLVSCNSNSPSVSSDAATSSDTSSTAPDTPAGTTSTALSNTTDTGVLPPAPEPETIKLMTFNLRYDTASHPAMATSVRGAHLMEVIEKYLPDSVGFNEATDTWMNFLRSEMKKRGYDYVGVGRDAGRDSAQLSGTGNEHTPVFYRSDKFELIDSGNFWLSTTPEIKGSSSWNSACKRICSYAVLKNKTTGEIYAHFSTHLDHVSVEAQYNGVMVIENYIRALVEKHGDIGVVLSGDFNTVRFDSNDPNYRPTTYNTVTSFMDDARELAVKKGIDGSSWSGYQSPVDWEKGHASNNDKPAVDTASSPIDYIFLKKGCYAVSYYTIVDDVFTFTHEGKTWTNHPVSDHYGVYCEVKKTGSSSGLVLKEDKLILHPAEAVKTASLPEKLAGKQVISDGISLSSGLRPKSGNLNDLLKGDKSVTVSVNGKTHGYWELKLALEDLARIDGFSFATGSGDLLPQMARIFVSQDGTNWEQVGPAFAEALTSSSTYYTIPEKELRGRYVLFLFADCDDGAALAGLSVYGEILDSGRIPNEEITLIEGPKSGEKEGYEKLFDDNTSTKFYIRLYPDNGVPAEPAPVDPIIFRTKNPTSIISYTLTNASDTASYTGRLPRKWTLYGSATGEEDSYVVIDEVTSPGLSPENFKTFSYTVKNPGTYTYYKLVFDTVGTTGNVQFSEIAFFEKGTL